MKETFEWCFAYRQTFCRCTHRDKETFSSYAIRTVANLEDLERVAYRSNHGERIPIVDLSDFIIKFNHGTPHENFML